MSILNHRKKYNDLREKATKYVYEKEFDIKWLETYKQRIEFAEFMKIEGYIPNQNLTIFKKEDEGFSMYSTNYFNNIYNTIIDKVIVGFDYKTENNQKATTDELIERYLLVNEKRNHFEKKFPIINEKLAAFKKQNKCLSRTAFNTKRLQIHCDLNREHYNCGSIVFSHKKTEFYIDVYQIAEEFPILVAFNETRDRAKDLVFDPSVFDDGERFLEKNKNTLLTARTDNTANIFWLKDAEDSESTDSKSTDSESADYGDESDDR